MSSGFIRITVATTRGDTPTEHNVPFEFDATSVDAIRLAVRAKFTEIFQGFPAETALLPLIGHADGFLRIYMKEHVVWVGIDFVSETERETEKQAVRDALEAASRTAGFRAPGASAT